MALAFGGGESNPLGVTRPWQDANAQQEILSADSARYRPAVKEYRRITNDVRSSPQSILRADEIFQSLPENLQGHVFSRRASHVSRAAFRANRRWASDEARNYNRLSQSRAQGNGLMRDRYMDINPMANPATTFQERLEMARSRQRARQSPQQRCDAERMADCRRAEANQRAGRNPGDSIFACAAQCNEKGERFNPSGGDF